MATKKLIIFDMDGVLLDSEPLYMEMNQRYFQQLGIHISRKEHESFVGMSATKMWTHIKQKYQLAEDVPYLKEKEKQLKYEMLSNTKLSPSRGIVEFLKFLKQKEYRLAIASSSPRRNIDLIIKKIETQTFFDFIISGEEVERGKPEPDIFLKTAAAFNLRPGECIVVEDSTNGIKAAKAAGMLCIGYKNPTSGQQDLSLANIIIDSFYDAELLNYFQ